MTIVQKERLTSTGVSRRLPVYEHHRTSRVTIEDKTRGLSISLIAERHKDIHYCGERNTCAHHPT